ncbi:hypothetical protein HRG_001195 [Hirsutella rhossiliensis]|uniref:Uncharacterized protein n=1 Tax=Hirsutella rhossiliensis TaxID=111463 RepID=A0A9P8SMG2_9HYPO|nr:uncharacterized protein HRG_01195 [Hirsutella rhossiliensis]KAH0968553.1 hypothetical protein HRG_01195 [Hirsutella rhossiliensis]
MSKRDRSPSPSAIHPPRAFKRPEAINDFQQFTQDVQDSVRQMLPTGGRRYAQAAILAVNFSVSDIPEVIPLRDELLDVLNKTYNCSVDKYTIDCTQAHPRALFNLNLAVLKFPGKNSSSDDTSGGLACIYFSGHGFQGSKEGLDVCGSYSASVPKQPYIPWAKLSLGHAPSPNDHRLVIRDCCAAGLANLDQSDVEVLGASAWESEAAVNPQVSFARALINDLDSKSRPLGQLFEIKPKTRKEHTPRTAANSILRTPKCSLVQLLAGAQYAAKDHELGEVLPFTGGKLFPALAD